VARLRFAGWRKLVDGRCETCGHRYLQDLPTGHGLLYPTTLDLDSGETFDPVGAAWFADSLARIWREPDVGPVAFEVDSRRQARDVVLLDCLDMVWGHSVLKLLNVQRELAERSDREVIAVVPGSLAPLVPEEVAEVWVVREQTPRFRGWLTGLERRMEAELDRFDSCLLSPAFPHPHPTTYDLPALAARFQPERVGEPSVLLSLREDRLWGSEAEAQQENVDRFVELLRSRFPDAGFAALGLGGASPLGAEVTDLRSAAPSDEIEGRWLGLARGADLVVGVHGSNLLLPSGLAGATIELLPQPRFGNALQATLVREHDPLMALANHRLWPGNADLSDVSPERVAELAVALLGVRERFALMMTGPASGERPGPVETLPPEHFRPYSAAPTVGRRRWKPQVDLRGTVRARVEALAARRRGVRIALRARRIPLPAVLTDRRGNRFELETPQEVRTFLEFGGHPEATEVDLASRCVQPGGVAFDVGANIGAFTAALARASGDGGAVHAFEPATATALRLERTIELNALANVVVNRAAVADEIGSRELYTYGPGLESWTGLAPREIQLEGRALEATATSAVETTSLDAYCATRGLERIDFLKLDVEGAEGRALVGAARLLGEDRIDLLMIELADTTLEAFGDTSNELVDTLERHGLTVRSLCDGELEPFRPLGRVETLTTVVASNARGDAALSRLGLVPAG
jgi:FkbM family methyltransferase